MTEVPKGAGGLRKHQLYSLRQEFLIKTLLQKKQKFYCTENMQYKSMTRDYRWFLNNTLRNITCVLKRSKDRTVLDSIK